MQLITLTNDFHNTSVNLRCEVLSHIYHTAVAYPNANQIKKAKRVLCGVAGCNCSNDAGIRGRQEIDGKRLEVNLDSLHKVRF
jgi:hypothetical protein